MKLKENKKIYILGTIVIVFVVLILVLLKVSNFFGNPEVDISTGLDNDGSIDLLLTYSNEFEPFLNDLYTISSPNQESIREVCNEYEEMLGSWFVDNDCTTKITSTLINDTRDSYMENEYRLTGSPSPIVEDSYISIILVGNSNGGHGLYFNVFYDKITNRWYVWSEKLWGNIYAYEE